MLRFRRYRIFWILAVFVIGALYHFNIFQEITTGEGNDVGGLKVFGPHRGHEHEHEYEHEHEDDHADQPAAAATAPEKLVSWVPELGPEEKDTEEKTVQEGKKYEEDEELLPESPSDVSKPTQPISETPSTSQQEKVAESPAADLNEDHKPGPVVDTKLDASPAESSTPAVDSPEEPGKGRLEVPTESPMPKVYWSKLPEHFPIPSASIIELPTGKPKPIPKIQHVFADESANEKIDREQKLAEIKKAFEFSWAGYRERAWMKDELSPVSGGSRNPFCEWAATLVDSLDTLWIMDMMEEFEEAVEAVKRIDFTTTERRDIPLFETVIRYLGGLLSAYDLSGIRILLDKAVELAEILIGAFDTPNRMPIGYYNWRP